MYQQVGITGVEELVFNPTSLALSIDILVDLFYALSIGILFHHRRCHKRHDRVGECGWQNKRSFVVYVDANNQWIGSSNYLYTAIGLNKRE